MQITADIKKYDEALKNKEKTMLNEKETWNTYQSDIIYYEDLQPTVLNNDVENKNK